MLSRRKWQWNGVWRADSHCPHRGTELLRYDHRQRESMKSRRPTTTLFSSLLCPHGRTGSE